MPGSPYSSLPCNIPYQRPVNQARYPPPSQDVPPLSYFSGSSSAAPAATPSPSSISRSSARLTLSIQQSSSSSAASAYSVGYSSSPSSYRDFLDTPLFKRGCCCFPMP